MSYCSLCHKEYSTLKIYKKHLKSVSHILRESGEMVTYSCACLKTFTHKTGLYRHRKQCDVFQNPDKGLSEIQKLRIENQELKRQRQLLDTDHKNEIEKIKSHIAILMDKDNRPPFPQHIEKQHIENQTTTTNSNNHNIHIHINAFGSENTDYIANTTFASSIEHVYKSIPAILEKIHFDPNHPENHNIKITNKKLPFAAVMGNNKKWKTVNKKEAIESMMNNGYYLLDEKYDETKEEISPFKQTCFEGFQEKYQSDDKYVKKQIKTEVELMVLNASKSI